MLKFDDKMLTSFSLWVLFVLFQWGPSGWEDRRGVEISGRGSGNKKDRANPFSFPCSSKCHMYKTMLYQLAYKNILRRCEAYFHRHFKARHYKQKGFVHIYFEVNKTNKIVHRNVLITLCTRMPIIFLYDFIENYNKTHRLSV